MGWLGTTQVAAHQIALNLASITFMVPLGLSSAAAVVVGHAVGRSRPGWRKRCGASRTGLCRQRSWARRLSRSPWRREYWPASIPRTHRYWRSPSMLLPLAGVFQVFDGIQVTSIGILRGLGDTRTPMIIGLLGYWVIGLPVSLWLGFRAGQGPVGLWWGLVLGLVIVALFLLDRVRRRLAASPASSAH